MKQQLPLFEIPRTPRLYHDALTASINQKGVIDVDTVKGCTMGMRARPDHGCYDDCYAQRIASRYGIAFEQSVSRGFVDQWQHRDAIVRQLRNFPASWYRIGVMGDPCHDWKQTLIVIRHLRPAEMTAVIITKHWVTLTDGQISELMDLDVVMNTSTSGFDTDAEMKHRVHQYERLRDHGIRSVNRVVTADYGDTEWGRAAKAKQDYLLTLPPIIDNPLRVSPSNPRVLSGDILTTRRLDSVGGGTLVSLHKQDVYLGSCEACPDQCGVVGTPKKETNMALDQGLLFPVFTALEPMLAYPTDDIVFERVESVTGSGYEAAVAELALEDGIAHRAARPNMQRHSAIIVLIGGRFAGFMTFQINPKAGEFCLLQSVIRPDAYSPELYRAMVEAVLACNTDGYAALMTTNPKSKFETPKVFESLGFETYLQMSGFHYMLAGDPAKHRMKTLAHITMTNVWNSVKADWLRLKGDWKQRIEEAGERESVANPSYATREGCWQGESGFANVVTGRSHNGNASVLDPVACEVILRFFTPNGGKVYNPFGGGVQFGFVAGASGYRYLASEIRQNQCDANNALCSEFDGVEWVQSDSSTFDPGEPVDLVFSCPPYYRVEKYVDYDGASPAGEINSLSSYVTFRDTLFTGYEMALSRLADDRFFVVMTGDSRDSKGGYHCHESETELWMKDHGLSVYNKVIYLEAEFTRLAQAKKTLDMRKFPKREQKIIVGYKGDIKKITENFPPIGRL
ncbi:MAG: hypothetical protein ABIN55_09135 [Aeromicrobium sp.]